MNKHDASTLFLCATLICGCFREEAKAEPPVAPVPARRVAVIPQEVTTVNQTSISADSVVVYAPQSAAPEAQPTPPPPPPSKTESGKWSADAIQKDPAGFIREQLADCDRLKAKIEAQKITLTRLGKQSARTVEESDGMIARYTAFLDKAKTAYKAAAAADSWPAVVDGFRLDEEQLSDRIADALERIELAKKDRDSAEKIKQKTEIRLRIVKAKTRELSSLRLKLVQQSEQVRMNQAFAGMEDLSSVAGSLRDMMLDIDENPATMTLEDLTAGDPDAAKRAAVRAFLDE